ncbi:transcriptional regulator GutM [Bacillus sp. OTU530]|uniref:transcriptional regulator GutM n=1 Tax=Bacillus sp. OTU530 TaxID=3043862 RepID=UPI00313CA22B
MKELLVIIVTLMILQFLTGILHIKYYQSVLRKMSKKSEGYLGVGMNRQKFKLNQICIMVTDVHGEITECRILSGFTIFSRFRKAPGYEGKNIFHMEWNGKEKYKEVMENAIQMIKNEMEKRNTNGLTTIELSAN